MFKFVQCSIKWCLTHSDWYYLWKFMESNVTSVLCCEFLFMSDSHFQQFHVKSSSFSLKITINWENVNSWISCFTQMVGSEITFMFDSWKFYSRLITKLPYFAILSTILPSILQLVTLIVCFSLLAEECLSLNYYILSLWKKHFDNYFCYI